MVEAGPLLFPLHQVLHDLQIWAQEHRWTVDPCKGFTQCREELKPSPCSRVTDNTHLPSLAPFT